MTSTIQVTEYEVRNAKYSSDDGYFIDCEYNHPVYGWIPFTASAHDTEQHGIDIYNLLKSGADIAVAPYTPPTTEQLAAEERAWRDSELSWFDSACYRNQFYWSSLTINQQNERMGFRTQLLKYPEQAGFPTDLSLRPVRPVIED